MGDWDFVLISLLFVDDEHKCRRNKIHSRYRKDFLKSLDIVGRRLRAMKIPRSCLQNQSESVWRKLYEAQNDQGLTGIRPWAQICAHLNFELRDCLITFPIFVLSQRLIARNVRKLFSFNRGVSHLNEACRIDDMSRGSLSCYEILTNN